jgi:hypothetical protein
MDVLSRRLAFATATPSIEGEPGGVEDFGRKTVSRRAAAWVCIPPGTQSQVALAICPRPSVAARDDRILTLPLNSLLIQRPATWGTPLLPAASLPEQVAALEAVERQEFPEDQMVFELHMLRVI